MGTSDVSGCPIRTGGTHGRKKSPGLQGDVRVEGSEYDLLLSDILETSATGEVMLLQNTFSLCLTFLFHVGSRQSDMSGHRVPTSKAVGKRTGEEDIEQSSNGGTSIHRRLINEE